jgi:arabinogalactan oligomer/maltooligosaccharide transport system permease protein
MSLQAVKPRPLIIGLVLALVLSVGFGLWIQSMGRAGLSSMVAERSALVSLSALTEVVEQVGLDGEALQPTVSRFVERHDGVTLARVIRFQGIRLMASTAAEDVGEQAAPRKMAREEKPLYDLGQSLRAAVDTNIQEERAFKNEIDLQPLPSGGLALAGPVEEGGKVAGAVLIETTPPAQQAGGTNWPQTFAVLLLPIALMVGLLKVLGDRPLLSLLAAAVLVIVATTLYGLWGMEAMHQERLAAEATIAEEITKTEDGVETLLAEQGLIVGALDSTAWDVDLFRQPRELITAAGVDEAAVAVREAADRRGYVNLIIPVGIAALVLLGFVGLGGAARTGAALSRHRVAYFYVLPAMAAMIILVFFPFSYGMLLSFTNSNVYNTDQPIGDIWIGVQNFIDILTDFELVKTTEDGRVFNYSNFYWTLGFTIIWTITNVAVGVTVGLFLALILNTKGLVLKPIYRVLLILPWAIPNYITALIWQGMYHSQFGVINQVIQMFGGEGLSWFDTPFTSFITVLSTNGWLSFPFMMVISLGALQSIPADLYEAARVDGATRWQQFRTITLPSLKPALVPAIIISVIWTFNQFNVIYLVSQGEPGGSTEILITEAYKIAFEQYRYGYAAAYSVVIFIILLTYGIWQNRVTGASEGV